MVPDVENSPDNADDVTPNHAVGDRGERLAVAHSLPNSISRIRMRPDSP